MEILGSLFAVRDPFGLSGRCFNGGRNRRGPWGPRFSFGWKVGWHRRRKARAEFPPTSVGGEGGGDRGGKARDKFPPRWGGGGGSGGSFDWGWFLPYARKDQSSLRMTTLL